jgi:MoxR-like ATPase
MEEMTPRIRQLNETSSQYAESLRAVRLEIEKVIVGQEYIIEKLLIALISGGHVLIEGVPGLAKTLSDCLDSDFVRLQFTPDLLPADIIGTKIYDHIHEFHSC